MYVPGASLRGTYSEELMGKRAPTNISRYLANLVNAAKDVEDLTNVLQSGGVGLSEDYQRKYADTLKKEIVKELTGVTKKFRGWERAGYPEQVTEYAANSAKVC